MSLFLKVLVFCEYVIIKKKTDSYNILNSNEKYRIWYGKYMVELYFAVKVDL